MLSKLKPHETRVVLLRHGQSTYNALGLYQGSSDRPNLTDLGRQQAEQTAEFLQEIAFDAIYASPLKRALETAQIVARSQQSATPPPLQIVPQLHETALPGWQGLPFQFVKEQFPEEYRCWKQRPHEFALKITPETRAEMTVGATKGMLSVLQNDQHFFPALDLYDRASRFWSSILPRHRGKTLLVVSHGGTNRALMSTALGISAARYHCLEQSNCALSVVKFPEEGGEFGQLEAMNRAAHVGETLPRAKEGFRLALVPAETENEAQIQALARILQDEAIDFSLSSNRDRSHSLAEQLLQSHPTAVRLQVARENLPHLWQQAIQKQIRIPASPLQTGLVVACQGTIRDFLGRILGLNSEQQNRLILQPGTLSLLHYPNAEHPPLLQGLNLALSPTSLLG